MKKNAFTLLEILGVITILALIAGIVFPIVTSMIQDSRNKTYEEQKELIIKAAKAYYVTYPEKLPDMSNGSYTTISVNKLITNGYIDSENLFNEVAIKDPRKKGRCLGGEVKITYRSNNYNYKYNEDSVNCET